HLSHLISPLPTVVRSTPMYLLKKYYLLPCLALIAMASFSWIAHSQESELNPEGRGKGKAIHDTHIPPGQAHSNARPHRGNGISYHGGPLILGTTKVYYIWYGNWSGNTATTILTDFANHIGGSSYFNINTTYYDGSNAHVSNAVSFGGSTTDN